MDRLYVQVQLQSAFVGSEWDVDPEALRALCEHGASLDGMSDRHIEAITPSLSHDEGSSVYEAKLLMWIYCEMEPWPIETEFLMYFRSLLEDLSRCLAVKVWARRVHQTAVSRTAATFKREGLRLALNKMQSAVAAGTFGNEA
jgi:hypothetical protein